MSTSVGFPPSAVANAAPPISVVIPAYNYAHYLPRTIDSILKQDYPPAEIIVVDDGSTDNTAEVVAKYGDKVRRIYQKNAGLPAARNTGIRAARHDYIAFSDADDEWEPTMLSRLMAIFATLPPEYAIVACHLDFIGPDSERLGMKNLIPAEHREITCRDIVLKTRFSSSSLVAKRKVFAECGYFDESLRSSEDRDMWMRIASKNRIYMTGERLSYIRRHPHNMSKHADRMKSNVRRVISKAYGAGLVPRSDLLFWMRVFSFYFFQNSWRYRDDGRYGKAIQQIVCSFLLWPFFPQSTWLNEPRFFRMRAAMRFMTEMVRGKRLANS
jgi:glycosyltransferase involved in cell wall biosynthesis